MIVVNCKEFVCNDEKYFDLAMKEQVYIQRDNMMFIISKVNDIQHKTPDDDFHMAITANELKKRMHVVVDKFFDQIDERNILTNGS